MSSPGESLCAFLNGCCERADASLPSGRAKDTIAAVRERLSEELLRVAVGGRLNAGKSTLVNSLLGTKLAATDATECTRLVSWFKYGLIDQVVVRLRDGRSVTLWGQPLAAAVTRAGCPAGDIAVIEVQSSNDTLKARYTVVDTPGLDSTSDLDAMSLAALRQADVLLYVLPHPGQNDIEALAKLRETAGEAGITALSTIGVLSRIDELGDGDGDPWPRARRIAGRYENQLPALVGAVIPVVGLLAETACGDQFSEADMGPLRELHRLSAADPAAIEAALYTSEDFRTHPMIKISAEDRDRLLSMLGRYGIRAALAELDRGIQAAATLMPALRARSGIDVLLDQLKRQFLGLADPLRARWALQALDAVTWLGTSPAEVAALTRLRDELDMVRVHPKLRQFGLMDSLTDLEAGHWQAPEDAAAELAALVTGTDLPAQLRTGQGTPPAELRALLVKRITAWHVLENTSARATARHARAVREYLESLFASLPRA